MLNHNKAIIVDCSTKIIKEKSTIAKAHWKKKLKVHLNLDLRTSKKYQGNPFNSSVKEGGAKFHNCYIF